MVAAELAELEQRLPRATPTLGESAATWRYLERERWRAQEGASVVVHGGRDGAGSVVTDRSGAWPMSPTFRHLVVVPLTALATAIGVLQRVAGRIEAVGYAGPAARLGEASAVAAAVGAHRLCPLARMQAPPCAWRQRGHPRLGSIVGVDTGSLPAAYA